MKKSVLTPFIILAVIASMIQPLRADTTTVQAPQALAAQIMTTASTSSSSSSYSPYILVSISDTTPPGQYTTVERSVDSGDFSIIATLSQGYDSYKDYGIGNGHVYKYRAKRTYSQTSSAYSNEAEVTYVYPNQFYIADAYSDQIDLVWSYPQLPVGRTADCRTVVERRLYGETSWQVIYTAPFSVCEYRDHDLKPATDYCYRIRTLYSNGQYSAYIPNNDYGLDKRTGIPLTTPLTGYAMSGNQIRLEWDSPTLSYTTACLQKKTSTGDFQTICSSSTLDHYIDSGLTPGKEYVYRLNLQSSYDSASVYTEELTVKTETIPAPTALSASPVSEGRISLSWSYPYDVESGFEVWRKEQGGIWQKIDSPAKDTTDWVDYSAVTDKTYLYQVRAVRGDTVFSDFIAASPVNNADPGVVPPIVVIPLEYYLLIGTDAAAPQGVKYTLEYRTGINDNWTDHTSSETGKPLLAQFILSAGKEFDIRLRSENQGNVHYGTIQHIYAAKPEAPSVLTAPTIGYGKVLLAWNDNTDKEDGYRIYKTSGGKRTLAGTADKNQCAYADTATAPGSAVKYEVCAYNARGESNTIKLNVAIPKKASFKDTSSILWGVDAVNTLCSMGAVSQNGYGLFYPSRTITVAEFTSMLLKTFDIVPQRSFLFSLRDVRTSDWYYPCMMTAVKLGLIIPDQSGNAGPSSPITKAGIAVLLDRFTAYRNQPLHAYDVSILGKFSDGGLVSDDLKEIAASLAGDSIMPAQNGQPLKLGASATRIEAAAILYKFYLKYK